LLFFVGEPMIFRHLDLRLPVIRDVLPDQDVDIWPLFFPPLFSFPLISNSNPFFCVFISWTWESKRAPSPPEKLIFLFPFWDGNPFSYVLPNSPSPLPTDGGSSSSLFTRLFENGVDLIFFFSPFSFPLFLHGRVVQAILFPPLPFPSWITGKKKRFLCSFPFSSSSFLSIGREKFNVFFHQTQSPPFGDAGAFGVVQKDFSLSF